MSIRTRPLLFCLLPCALAMPLAAQAGHSTQGRAATKRFAALGLLPDPALVVVEDIINYRRHGIALPKAGNTVALDVRWDAPRGWEARESILQVGFATGQILDARARTPLNIALVIDESGSMAADDKMSRVKEGLLKLVQRLHPEDRIAIVGYSTRATLSLHSQRVGDGSTVRNVIRSLQARGSTNLHAGLMLGYREVAKHCEESGAHRVILLTDGLITAGVSDEPRIVRESKAFNNRKIDLSTIGVGTDFNQKLLAKLAKAGRGMFHFVADHKDIAKVFVTEAQSLVGTVARKVRLSIQHGPDIEVAQVYGYRPKQKRDGLKIDLENLNLGATGVAMIRMRARNPHAESEIQCPVRVVLSFEDATTGKRVTLSERTQFLDPTQASGTSDHEVRKNFTIARMAQATKDMAVAAKKSRFDEAERALRSALKFYKSQYPNTDDAELKSNAKTLRKYQKSIAARIERFRRL